MAFATGCVAAAALHESSEEVVVARVAVGASSAGVEDVLDALEEVGCDEGCVASGAGFAFEADFPDVVGVAEDGSELAAGEGVSALLGGASGGEALLFQFCGQCGQAVFAGGVLLEGPADDGGAFGVDVDGVGESTVEVLADIEVAEFGSADGTAVLRLVPHLVRDVLAVLPDLNLVHDVSDGLHGITHVALTELLLRGNQLHPHGRQHPLGDGGVGEVAEGSGPHVDHHVPDLGVVLDVAQQLLEHRVFGDGLGRGARLDELAGDGGLQPHAPLDTRLALGGDGVAVLVDVDGGVHLAGGGDPQVQHGFRAVGDVALGYRGDAVQTEEQLEVAQGTASSAWCSCALFSLCHWGPPFPAEPVSPASSIDAWFAWKVQSFASLLKDVAPVVGFDDGVGVS
nr:hypothetical protein [Arachnia propionica]